MQKNRQRPNAIARPAFCIVHCAFCILHSAFCIAAGGESAAALEGRLRTSILAKVNEANPFDPATSARAYISFGFITDIHKCRRVPGDDDDANPATDHWYGSAGVLTEAEQSIRLLGAVAAEAGLDAVICGGDFSTAPILGSGRGLTEAEYTNEIWNVKAMFDKYLPADLPRFTVDGNHERGYTRNGADMHLSDEAWAFVLTNFNTTAKAARGRGVDIAYHRELSGATLSEGRRGRFTGNSYHLDFRRLLATKGVNVRIACVSSYDGAVGGDVRYRVFDAAQFHDPADGRPYDAAKTPENTIMGMVSHEPLRGAAGTLQNGFMNGYSNPMAHSGPWNGGTHRGKGFFGLVCGHQHFTNVREIRDAFDMKANSGNDIHASMVQVASAYAVNRPGKPKEHELGTERAYHFSLFVVDTDKKLLREIRVGGASQSGQRELPVVQLHSTHIRTAGK